MRRIFVPAALFLLAALSFTAVCFGEAAASSSSLESESAGVLLRRLDERLASITTLKGRFVQSFVSSGLAAPQSESGRFFLKKPGLMRWEYLKPERKLGISDGRHTYLHVPEDATVYRGRVDSPEDQGALGVLSGMSLAEHYEARGLDAAQALRRGDVVLSLQPRRAREEFATLLIEIEPRSLRIVAVTAVDGMGNRMGMLLDDLEENVPLDEALFSFTLPPGARIVDSTAR